MNRTRLKLAARQSLASKSAYARRAVMLNIIIRLCILALSAFFIYSMYLLPRFSKSATVSAPVELFYVLFSVCIVILLCARTVFNYLLHRWFFIGDAKSKRSGYFVILPVRFQLKIIYLHFLRFSRCFSLILFYLLPFAAMLAFLRIRLASGMDRRLFALCCVSAILYLLTGLYYLLASRQKTAFCDEAVTLYPDRSARKSFAALLECDDKSCCEAAKLKLSFAGWYALCVLILPLFFVIAYYMQTMAEYKKTDLESQGL